MDREGVIKFTLRYTRRASVPVAWLRDLSVWRQRLYAAGFIGRDPHRYGGYGYGNLSRRLEPYAAAPLRRRFVITATQTGQRATLTPDDYAVVTACSPAGNWVKAGGPAPPSSESMTHAVIYAQDLRLRWVMHVHAPRLWRQAAALGLPLTRADVAYGTPEMAAEVVRLFRETDIRSRGLFAMGGHEDGLVTFGPTAQAAFNGLQQACDLARTPIAACAIGQGY